MAETYGQEPQYRTVRERDFSGGVRDDKPATAIEGGESPSALNIEFDRGSIATTRGSRKFNNQPAPFSAVLCRVDPALSPLPVQSGMSVPIRGYCIFPWGSESDLGGNFAQE